MTCRSRIEKDIEIEAHKYIGKTTFFQAKHQKIITLNWNFRFVKSQIGWGKARKQHSSTSSLKNDIWIKRVSDVLH